MKIHIVGDSHVEIFRMLSKLGQPFVINHLGPLTAFNLMNKAIFWEYIDNIEKDDKLVLSFGEIDCRIHIYYQHKKTGEEISEIIARTIDNYDAVLAKLKNRGIDFAVYNIIPVGLITDAPQWEKYVGGPDKVTVKIKDDFNKALRKLCEDKGYKFIDVLDKIRDASGHIPKELHGEPDHLSAMALPIIEPEIERLFGLDLLHWAENEREKKMKDYWDKNTPQAFIDEGCSPKEARRKRMEIVPYLYPMVNFKQYRGKVVLDLGCGSGIDAVEFAKHGAIIAAADASKHAIDLVWDLISKTHPVDLNITPTQAVAYSLPWEVDIFDLVYSIGVLHHIPDVDKALAEIVRVLKPDGRFFGMVYNRDSLLYAYSIIYLHGMKEGLLTSMTAQEILSLYSERVLGCPYTKAYNKVEAEELFYKYFKVVKVTPHYGVIDTPEKRKRVIPGTEDLGWHLIIEADHPIKR